MSAFNIGLASVLIASMVGVSCLALWLSTWLTERRRREVAGQPLSVPMGLPWWFRWAWRVQWLTMPLARGLGVYWPEGRLLTQLKQLGWHQPQLATRFRAVQLALGLGLAAWAGVMGGTQGFSMTWCAGVGLLLGLGLPLIWVRDQLKARQRQLVRQLPFFLDMVALVLEAGSTVTHAMVVAAQSLPSGPLQEELQRVQADFRLGISRIDAFGALVARCQDQAIAQFATAVLAAEKQGISLGPVLRSQAAQRRSERFQRAEKAAMQAPVRLLAPLIMCIFPCTFVILMFPIASKLLMSGGGY